MTFLKHNITYMHQTMRVPAPRHTQEILCQNSYLGLNVRIPTPGIFFYHLWYQNPGSMVCQSDGLCVCVCVWGEGAGESHLLVHYK